MMLTQNFGKLLCKSGRIGMSRNFSEVKTKIEDLAISRDLLGILKGKTMTLLKMESVFSVESVHGLDTYKLSVLIN